MKDSFDPEKTLWDIIVVGTGMGGATLGYALAKAGKRVLFCERGRSHLDKSSALMGDYAEHFFHRPAVAQRQHKTILAQAGRYTDLIEDFSGSQPRSHIPFIGQGTGGSSALYGMAMERFFPEDFYPRTQFAEVNNTSLPEAWPIRYEDLAPYYTLAEQLYGVRGTLDPLRPTETPTSLLPPPSLSAANQHLYEKLKRRGLHPYQLPLACEWVAGCQGCQGYLCPNACKNDSSRACLSPALNQYGAQLLDECQALGLETHGDRVKTVVCAWQGKTVRLQAKQVVLAAGALQTPVLLLNSACPEWPSGLANESGLVGRNLMRHCIDLYAVFVSKQPISHSNDKELGCNDFYRNKDTKLGSLQSFGSLPPAPILVEQMQQDLREGRYPQMARVFGLAKPLFKGIFSQLFSRSLILASIMEDLPHPENRVQPGSSPDRIQLHYQLHPYDKQRIQLFRQMLNKALKPQRFMLLKQAENNDRIAHVCGTCRFGVNPRESILNPFNRAHSVANLYVVDSSFFPSSGGTNPSLTIAANALRVADHMLGKSLQTPQSLQKLQ
jgi:choline dehydrogenase-like flavoprotein